MFTTDAINRAHGKLETLLHNQVRQERSNYNVFCVLMLEPNSHAAGSSIVLSTLAASVEQRGAGSARVAPLISKSSYAVASLLVDNDFIHLVGSVLEPNGRLRKAHVLQPGMLCSMYKQDNIQNLPLWHLFRHFPKSQQSLPHEERQSVLLPP